MNIFVNEDKINYNIDLIKKITKKDIIAVVKSNAYGLGVEKIITILKKKNITWFAFNKIEEYLQVKDLVINCNNLILSSLSKEQIIKNKTSNLIYTINSLNDALIINSIDFSCRVHLSIDTGMNRLGIKNIKEFEEILTILQKKENINIEGIYTHFSSGVDEYEYYEIQKKKFITYLKNIPFKIIHTCATSSLHKHMIGNYVRIGIGLYGMGNKKVPLKRAISGQTKLINILDCNKGDKIGYSQTYICEKKQFIGVLPFGYYELPLIKKVYSFDNEFEIIAKKCMNHTYIILDDKINVLSRLSLFGKNDIIDRDEYDWYQMIVCFDHLPKTYMKRGKYELSNFFKATNAKSTQCSSRIRSNSHFSSGIIRI